MPDSATMTSRRKLFVILNPASGTSSADVVKKALGAHFSCDDGSCHVHEVKDREDLGALAKEAASRDVEVVVAAGGDGTVSAVANGLVGSKTPLGILPLGTANILARELGIPTDLNAACALIAGEFTTTAVDAMKVGEAHYFTQVGVGIDALMIRDTSTRDKKRFGRLAYMWTGMSRLIGFQPVRFTLTIDGRHVKARASQVLVANCATLGQKPLTWGPDIRVDDGVVDLCVIRARTLWQYAKLSWHVLRGTHRDDPRLHYRKVSKSVTIHTKKPLPVQGDGEVIGNTPVEVKVVPGAVRVVVPGGES